MHPEYGKYDYLRDRLERETNFMNIPIVSFGIFKKDKAERKFLKESKKEWKQGMLSAYGTNWRKFNNVVSE